MPHESSLLFEASYLTKNSHPLSVMIIVLFHCFRIAIFIFFVKYHFELFSCVFNLYDCSHFFINLVHCFANHNNLRDSYKLYIVFLPGQRHLHGFLFCHLELVSRFLPFSMLQARKKSSFFYFNLETNHSFVLTDYAGPNYLFKNWKNLLCYCLQTNYVRNSITIISEFTYHS